MIRIILMIFGGFAAMAALLVLSVYWRSEARLRDYEMPPPFTTEIPTDAASLEKGKHIARTRGCFGCHGQELEGGISPTYGTGRNVPLRRTWRRSRARTVPPRSRRRSGTASGRMAGRCIPCRPITGYTSLTTTLPR